MAVTATPSKFTVKWNSMCALLCLFVAVWFYWDGHYNQKYIEKETIDGKPTANLVFNHTWGPILCLASAVYLGVMVMNVRKKKVTVDENGITFADGKNIPLASLTKIDKTKFRKKGKIFIEYEDGDKLAVVELRDTVYDGIKDLIDEIVRLSGQKPEETQEPEEKPEN